METNLKESLRKRIFEMTGLVGVSGNEWDVARYIKNALQGYVDDVVVRPNGMLVAHIKGAQPGSRKMVSAHMDEVGYTVKSIDNNGFIFFDKIGFPTDACIPGRRVWVKGKKEAVPGIIGTRAGHLLTPEDMAKPQSVRQSYIDVGMSSCEEVKALGIGVGSQIVMDSPCKPLLNQDLISGRAMDCRVLCAIIVETLRNIKAEDIKGDLFAAFDVIEEPSTACGAAAVHYCEPDYALFTDTIPCGDVPDCDFLKELPIRLQGGPAILYGQYFVVAGKYAASHPKLIDALIDSANEAGCHYQEFAFNSAGYATDAVGALNAGSGCAVASMALPRRYSHSPVELIHMDDVMDFYKIFNEYIKKDVDLNMI